MDGWTDGSTAGVAAIGRGRTGQCSRVRNQSPTARPPWKGFWSERGWFEIVREAPSDCDWCQFWDLAATKTVGSTDPRYTVGVLLGRSREGQLFVKDVRRIRDLPLAVERLVRQTTELDGMRVPIRMEQDGGSGGPITIDLYERSILVGFDFRGVKPTGTR
jgi:phage terminase large subunit-like protein